MNFKISNIPGNSVYIKNKKLSEILGQRPNFVLNHGFSPKKIVFIWNQFHISQFLSSAPREYSYVQIMPRTILFELIRHKIPRLYLVYNWFKAGVDKLLVEFERNKEQSKYRWITFGSSTNFIGFGITTISALLQILGISDRCEKGSHVTRISKQLKHKL